MATSGQTAIATVDDNPVVLLSADEQPGLVHWVIINESKVPGFFSTDGGVSWRRWPDGATVVESLGAGGPLKLGVAILFKRAPGGANATGLYAWGD